MFVMTADESALLAEGVSVDRAALRDTWDTQLNSLLNKATLQWPDSDWQLTGGREGLHTEHHGHLLAEMQFMQRAYPGLKW
jgi:ring-1,2-phenylacetyl-CoA epoxidase subunit PaaC